MKGGSMDGSFDSNKKIGKFLNLLFWLPFIFLEAGDNCGDEYNKACCLAMAIGTVFPGITLLLFLKFDWKISVLEKGVSSIIFSLTLNGWFLGIFFSLLVYLLVGLLVHYIFKSQLSAGIL